ncbi:hypothetical protein AGMMS49975_17610 [Clostridia bacterium]|nr:hypothetical protein AGMMS49975_17610 [Clostridia bacterium]
MILYNTLSAKKEEFTFGNPTKIYVCGPTVYNFIHIGNARAMIVFDAFRRYLLHKGQEVVYVQNYTDIDDKIIQKANAEGVSAEEIADRYVGEVETDMAGINILPPTHTPRVTREIPEIIDMIQTLIDKGNAYENDGTVFYDTLSFKEYGKLSSVSAFLERLSKFLAQVFIRL